MSAANGTSEPEIVPIRLRSARRYAENPLINPKAVSSRKKTVRVLRGGHYADLVTGEHVAQTGVFISKEIDEATFVKVFDAGIRAAFDLKPAGFKVFQLVLKLVASGKMQDDQITLHVSYATDTKSPLRMSDKTFWRGLRELMMKQFIATSTVPSLYWINPHLFFKGDRLTIVNEYIREQKKPAIASATKSSPLDSTGTG